MVPLIGIPAGGKSKLSEELQAALRRTLPKSVTLVVSYDILIPDIQLQHWKYQRSQVLEMIAHILQSLRRGEPDRVPDELPGFPTHSLTNSFLNHNQISAKELRESNEIVLIFDDNFYYRSMRYEIYEMAMDFRAGFCEVFVSVDVETAIQRNSIRSKPIPEMIIRRMAQVLEAPLQTERSFERNSLKLSSPWSEKELQDAVAMILTALENPCERISSLDRENILLEKTRAQELTKRSVLHQADCMLRKLVGERYLALSKEKNSDFDPGKSNAWRREILENLKKLDLLYFDVRPAELQEFVTKEFNKSGKP